MLSNANFQTLSIGIKVSTNMSSRRRLLLISAGCLVLACGLWFFAALPVSRPIKEGLRTERLNNVVRIRNLMRSYVEASGTIPLKLSDLFTKDVSTSNIALFFGPHKATNGTWRVSANALTNFTTIEAAGYYVYLGTSNAQSDLLLYERPGIWTTGVDTSLDGGVFAIDKSFNVIFRAFNNMSLPPGGK